MPALHCTHLPGAEISVPHTLIAALQIIQNLLGFTTISCKVTRNNFHIIAGTHRLFLVE